VPDNTVVLKVTGAVKNPLALTASDLSKYPQISIVNQTYGRSGGRVYQITATGASLNAIMDVAQSQGTVAHFLATDGFDNGGILISAPSNKILSIRGDIRSMITLNWSNTEDFYDANGEPTGQKCSNLNEGLRVIFPSQYYGQYNTFNLYEIHVE
jgi:hypothetical protein